MSRFIRNVRNVRDVDLFAGYLNGIVVGTGCGSVYGLYNVGKYIQNDNTDKSFGRNILNIGAIHFRDTFFGLCYGIASPYTIIIGSKWIYDKITE